MTTAFLVDVLGWIASIMLILAYWLVSTDRLSGQSPIYHSLNLIGSAFLIINTCYYGAYPSAAVNVIWVFIGLFYFMNYWKGKRGEEQEK